MKSIRFNSELEARLERLARERGQSVPEVIREAIRRYCDKELGAPSAAERMRDFIGCFDGPSGADSRSVDTGRKYAEALAE